MAVLLFWGMIIWMVIAAAIVIVVFLLFGNKSSMGGDKVRFYYRLIPLKEASEDLIEKLQIELGRRGVYSVRQGEELVLDDIIEWRLRLEKYGDTPYLSVEASVKTWYLVVTIIGLVLLFVIGAILGVIAFFKYSEKRDALRSALIPLTKDPSIAAQL